MQQAAALGFRTHSGWAAVVAVAGSPRAPLVLERCGIDIADLAVPGSKQPYHAAEDWGIDQADHWLCRCRDASHALAVHEVGAMAARLRKNGFPLVGAAILLASGRTLPDLAAILRSHALIHTAEGEFYREVAAHACAECFLAVTKVKEREVWDLGAAAFQMTPAEIQQSVGNLGKLIGPPWAQDEKLASMAAWLALTSSRSG